jgi:hypothetical protein
VFEWEGVKTFKQILIHLGWKEHKFH